MELLFDGNEKEKIHTNTSFCFSMMMICFKLRNKLDAFLIGFQLRKCYPYHHHHHNDLMQL